MQFSEIFKKGYGKPSTTDVIEGGLCIDISEKKAWSKDESGEVFQIGLSAEDVIELVENFGGLTPVNGIIMFSGQTSTLPVNWVICDGTNGTPNLTDKFILGTDIQDNIGDPGGYADPILVQHNHTTPSHSHTVDISDVSNHKHTIPGMISVPHNGGSGNFASSVQSGSISSAGAGAHGHTADVGDANPTTNNSGTTTVAGRNYPPYVKLAYIMRLS